MSVQPNPAVDEARVLSSFGLRGIEAYNAGGQKVYEGKAKGLEATLDVKGWPRGTYLLRITTPLGTVTKKLLEQKKAPCPHPAWGFYVQGEEPLKIFFAM